CQVRLVTITTMGEESSHVKEASVYEMLEPTLRILDARGLMFAQDNLDLLPQ
ncbi:hypothetical protein ACJMK2_012986, partial [Sinanodonta woodiana]